MRRIYIVSIISIILLLANLSSEYIFFQQNEITWVEKIQKRVSAQENIADKTLLKISENPDWLSQTNEEVIYLTFKNGELKYWSDEINDVYQLYERIYFGDNIVKLGNTYYVKRKLFSSGLEHFALISIQDKFQYKTKYLQDKYSSFLKIPDSNFDKISFYFDSEFQGHIIRNKEGNALFTINFAADYQEQTGRILLIVGYIIVFLSLFYVYTLLLKQANSWRQQLKIIISFLLLLLCIRTLILYAGFPAVIAQLPIFNDYTNISIFRVNIGDVIMIIFCISEIFSLTLYNLKINFTQQIEKKYIYILASIFIFLILIYVDVFKFASQLVIDDLDAYINLSSFISTYGISLFAFVVICIIGQLLLVSTFTYSSIFKQIFTLRENIIIIILSSIIFVLFNNIMNTSSIDNIDYVFVILGIIVVSICHYKLSDNHLQHLYLISIFMLSLYTVFVTQKLEYNKEKSRRIEFAKELIAERDYSFEEQLPKIEDIIKQSKYLSLLIQERRFVEAVQLLNTDLLNISGYNYSLHISFKNKNKKNYQSQNQQKDIDKYGTLIPNTNFYTISKFDGITSYIGRIDYNDYILYLGFSTTHDEDKRGYVRALSRFIYLNKDKYYDYSYAKYTDGILASYKGVYVYTKRLDRLTQYSEEVFFTKDKYSHLYYPIEDNNVLILSVPNRISRLYYFNVFCTFFIYMILASYGLYFFKIKSRKEKYKLSLQNQIKNSTILLIFVLLAILVTLTLVVNSRTVEQSRRNTSLELITFTCNQIDAITKYGDNMILSIAEAITDIGKSLSIDINIYDSKGRLVISTYPDIFKQHLDGMIINPRAYHKIMINGESSYLEEETIGEIQCMSSYMPIYLGRNMYIIHIPYFKINDNLIYDISFIAISTINMVLIIMILAFIFSELIANRVVQPLRMINEKLSLTSIGGKNEKLNYHKKNEIGMLVNEYNNMVDKLDNSIEQLARSERETAWQEMARQIAHEVKNPLTPMKLNIQFMQRAVEHEEPEKFQERFREYAKGLIEQIDDMAKTASAFSDFAKISIANKEVINIDELVVSCVKLFENSVDEIHCRVTSNSFVFADKEQLKRVFINIIKNAEQSIPQNRMGKIDVYVIRQEDKVKITICDNGIGIPPEIQQKIFTPNFTTKNSGTGLGLAISHKIIEDINGEITFLSNIDKGTEFTITLSVYDI